MQEKDPVVIVSAKRSPIGKMLGTLATCSATELGAQVVGGLLQEVSFDHAHINEIFMGCVLPAGLGQAPARQVALGAGLKNTVHATTLNKVCGSGMQALIIAHDMLLVDSMEIALAGGIESMSNAPFLQKKARTGYRLGHHIIHDHMLLDGLEDAYSVGTAMGAFAETCAKEYGQTRAAQDEFAMESFKRARKAEEMQAFQKEIVPIIVSSKRGETKVMQDEGPFAVPFENIPKLPPAFKENGVITAGNSSSIADGAAVLLMMRASKAKAFGLKPLVKVVGHATHAMAPSLFPIAPVGAIKRLLTKIAWDIASVDLFEVNEAFASVTLYAMQELAISHEKMNVHGGACALGHPIGASGARILVTLIHALTQLGKTRGVASLCIGGGEATAVAVEVLP